MIHYLSIGILLGLSAGLAPGPLLMLVISDTLRHGTGAGIKVALAPVITDLPIILLSLFILKRLAAFESVLGIVSLAGGLFILVMGYESIRTKAVAFEFEADASGSLTKGILANALNPHPYLFWITVGAPLTTRALELGLVPLMAFFAGFYGLLVGSKVILAVAVGKSRSFLCGRVYLHTLHLLGLLLCILALFLFYDGIRLLGLPSLITR